MLHWVAAFFRLARRTFRKLEWNSKLASLSFPDKKIWVGGLLLFSHTCHICSDEVIFRVSTTKLGSSLEIKSTMMYFQCKEEEWKQILNENLQICKSLNPLVWQILQRNKIRRLQKNFPLMAMRVRWSRVCYFVGILMELMGSHD